MLFTTATLDTCYLTCVVPFAEGPLLCAEEMQDMP